MTELRLVQGTPDADSARQRAQWLVELADIQDFTMERISQRYVDWNRLSASADEAAAIFIELETSSDRELAAA